MYFSKVVDNALLRFQRINLSFINTNPIYDIGLLVCLTPLWWILGIESIAYPIGSFLILLKVVTLRKGKVRLPSTLKWIFLFLLVSLISGVFIIESFRWITFIRNFTVFLTVFSITCIVVNSVKDWADIRFLVKVIEIIAGISAFFGVLGILNIWRPNIISQLGKRLSEWIASTNYGKTIVFRKFGNNAYYQLVGTYFRVKSIFAYSILYASSLAFTIPIAVYFNQLVII